MSSTSSITDVAALARVSKATVSRVLSGRRTKDDNIAKRVRDVAEQLNYQANSAASALRSDTTNTIGLIMPGPTDPLAARLLAELEPEVNRSGRQLLLGLGAGGCTTRGNSPADGAKCAGTLRKSYGRSPAIHALSFRCGTGGSATFAKEGDEGTSARPSSVISRSGISFPEKFPSPPQIPESGCSLSGNPWKTQSIMKRILQR